MFKIPEILAKHAMRYQPGGSRYICNPPPMDTDEDWIAYVGDAQSSAFINALEAEGWEHCGDYLPFEDVSAFDAFRMDIGGVDTNIIIFRTLRAYNKYVTATELAKRLNILRKKDRIALFDVVARGAKTPDDTAFEPAWKPS